MTSTDVIQQMAKECRRLAVTARNADDKAFWLELGERWKAVESRNARQLCLRQGGHLQGDSSGRTGQPAGASSGRAAKLRRTTSQAPSKVR